MRSARPAITLRIIVVLTVLAIPAHGATAQDRDNATAPTKVNVRALGHTLSLSAKDVSVEHVLEAVIRETGLRAVVHGALERRVSLEFQDLPLSETMRRILTEESFVLRQVHTAGSSASAKHIVTLWVFETQASQAPVRTARRLGEWSGAIGDVDALRADVVNGDTGERERALRALRRLDAGAAVSPISLALGDDDADVRVEAIYALSDVGGGDAAASLTGALFDENPWVRQEAVYALGATGGAAAIDALRPALRDSESPVRESAIEAYATIGGDESARALGTALDDAEHSVRMLAVLALGEIGGTVAADLLRRAAEDADPRVREAAAGMLADIDGKPVRPPWQGAVRRFAAEAR